MFVKPAVDVGDDLTVVVQVPQSTAHLAPGHGLVVVRHVAHLPVGTADGPVLVQRLVVVLGPQQLDVLLRVAVQVQQVLSQLLGRLEVGRVDEGAGCGVLLSTHNTGTWIGTSVSRHGHMDWYVCQQTWAHGLVRLSADMGTWIGTSRQHNMETRIGKSVKDNRGTRIGSSCQHAT